MKRKQAINTPDELANILIADLGNGTATGNGDRSSNYFVMAKDIGPTTDEVCVALIEEKANLPEDEWYYSIHVINDIDDEDAYLETTDSLDKQELVTLLSDTMKALNCAMKED